MDEGCGGDYNSLTCDPIDVLADCEGSFAWGNGCRDSCPGWKSGFSIHGELTIVARYSLISEHWLLLSEEISIQNELKIAM